MGKIGKITLCGLLLLNLWNTLYKEKSINNGETYIWQNKNKIEISIKRDDLIIKYVGHYDKPKHILDNKDYILEKVFRNSKRCQAKYFDLAIFKKIADIGQYQYTMNLENELLILEPTPSFNGVIFKSIKPRPKDRKELYLYDFDGDEELDRVSDKFYELSTSFYAKDEFNRIKQHISK